MFGLFKKIIICDRSAKINILTLEGYLVYDQTMTGKIHILVISYNHLPLVLEIIFIFTFLFDSYKLIVFRHL